MQVPGNVLTILSDAFDAIDIDFLARVAAHVKPEVLFVSLALEHLRETYPDARAGGRYPVAADGRAGMADLSIGPDLRWELKAGYGFDHRNAERQTWLIKNEVAKDVARLQAFAGDGRVGTFAWLIYFGPSPKYGQCRDEQVVCLANWTSVIARTYQPAVVHERGRFALFELEFR